MIPTDSWCPIVDCLILDPNHHLAILVHRIMLACCLLVIMILILIIHSRFVSIIMLQHTQNNSSYQDLFKSIPPTLMEKFHCAGSSKLIWQYILIWIIPLKIVIVGLEMCIPFLININFVIIYDIWYCFTSYDKCTYWKSLWIKVLLNAVNVNVMLCLNIHGC